MIEIIKICFLLLPAISAYDQAPFDFNGTMDRPTMESYLSRSMSMQGVGIHLYEEAQNHECTTPDEPPNDPNDLD